MTAQWAGRQNDVDNPLPMHRVLGLSSTPPDQEVVDAHAEQWDGEVRLPPARPRHVHDDRTVYALRGGEVVMVIQCVDCGEYDDLPTFVASRTMSIIE